MEPNTIRLPANTWEALTEEATEYGFRNRSEYIRHLIEHRRTIRENTQANTTDYEATLTEHGFESLGDLAEHLAALEDRVDDLAGAAMRTEPEPPREDETGVETDSRAVTGHTIPDSVPADVTEASGESGERADETGAKQHPTGDVDEVLQECRREWARSNPDEKVDAMVRAAEAALERLRDGEELRTGDFPDILQEDYPVPDQPLGTDTYQRKTIRPALDVAEDHGLVEQETGSWFWRWTGPE